MFHRPRVPGEHLAALGTDAHGARLLSLPVSRSVSSSNQGCPAVAGRMHLAVLGQWKRSTYRKGEAPCDNKDSEICRMG